MLGAFFDDSGTHAGSPVLTVGGLLGTEDQWDQFAAAWTALLARPFDDKPPLRNCHLSACRAGDGEFSTYNQAERDRITYLFRRIIVDLDMVTIAAAVDNAAWDELARGETREMIVDPIGYCYVKCMDLLLQVIRSRKPGEKVAVAFDEGVRRHLELWSRFYRVQPDKYPEIETIYFAPVNRVVALQGADMIATETFYFGQRWLRHGADAKPNPHFVEFMQRQLSVGLILDRDAIANIIENMRDAEATGR